MSWAPGMSICSFEALSVKTRTPLYLLCCLCHSMDVPFFFFFSILEIIEHIHDYPVGLERVELYCDTVKQTASIFEIESAFASDLMAMLKTFHHQLWPEPIPRRCHIVCPQINCFWRHAGQINFLANGYSLKTKFIRVVFIYLLKICEQFNTQLCSCFIHEGVSTKPFLTILIL